MKVNKKKKENIDAHYKETNRIFTHKIKIFEQNVVLLELNMETTEIKSDKDMTLSYLNLNILMILQIIYMLLDKSWPCGFHLTAYQQHYSLYSKFCNVFYCWASGITQSSLDEEMYGK